MKRIIIILCAACISAGAMAQHTVRIGNLEFAVRKTGEDTVTQITVNDPCPPCPSENQIRSKSNPYKYHRSDCFFGLGFALPDNGSSYYSLLGSKSMSIDVGGIHRYQLSRHFALGGTFNYSYYNYRLHDADADPTFRNEILDGRTFADVRKLAFRSHNIAVGPFMRFYLVAPKNRDNDGALYIDLGVQGDFAFSKYCVLKSQSEGKHKFRDGYAFNPFSASWVARVGWNDFAVFARYRFTEAFNSKALSMDLPPITIGIQIL